MISFNKLFKNSQTEFIANWVNFWVFIFSISVVGLNHLSGISAVILIITMIFIFYNKNQSIYNFKLDKNEIIFVGLIVLFWMNNLLITFFQPKDVKFENISIAITAIDNPMRWLLMLPVFFLLRRYKLDWRLISIGLSIGVFISVIIAMYEVYFLGYARATGGMNNIIIFGELMVVADMLLWVFMISAWNNNKKSLALFLLLASLFAFYGSLLSVTRGAWLVYIFMIFSLFFYLLKRSISTKKYFFLKPFLIRVALTFVVFFIVSQTPQYKTIQGKTISTINYIASKGNSNIWGSEGTRIDIFRTAIEIGRNFPFGVGSDNFQGGAKAIVIKNALNSKNLTQVRDETNSLVDLNNLKGNMHKFKYLQSFNKDGSIIFTSKMRHAHNEWLNAFAENGFLGVVLLTLIFIFPFKIFWNNLKHKNEMVGMYSYCGILHLVSFAIFGQTHSIFSSHATLIFFIFFLYLFTAQIFKLTR